MTRDDVMAARAEQFDAALSFARVTHELNTANQALAAARRKYEVAGGQLHAADSRARRVEEQAIAQAIAEEVRKESAPIVLDEVAK